MHAVVIQKNTTKDNKGAVMGRCTTQVLIPAVKDSYMTPAHTSAARNSYTRGIRTPDAAVHKVTITEHTCAAKAK